MASRPWRDRKGGRRDFESFREKLVSEGRLRAWPTPVREEKTPERKRSDRVNFLWLMADQLRADTFGFAGHPFIKTPGLDRLAREGAVFTNSFCSSPVCMPSRATFLTGHYCFTHGVIQNGCRMRESETVFPALLRGAGYRTANIGKDHAGRRPAEIWEYHEFVEDAFGATKPSKVPFDPGNFPELVFLGYESCDTSDSVLHGVYPAPASVTKSHVLANQAMKWLYYHDDPRPFFLRVSFDDPHPPVTPPEPFAGMYDPERIPEELFAGGAENMATRTPTVREYWRYRGMDRITEADHRRHMARYCGLVSHLDAEMGRILDYLDELGLTENTIVLLNSDHGHMTGEHGLTHKGPICYEGVIRIPTVIRAPGLVGSGTRIDALVEGVDLMPTVLDLLGVEVPAGMHGRSWLPLLAGETGSLRPHAFVTWDDYGFCIRGTKWKLIKYDSDEGGELYDVEADPRETRNLYDEPAVREVREELLGRLEAWRGEYARSEDHPYPER